MTKAIPLFLVAAMVLAPQPVLADASVGFERGSDRADSKELPPYLQCVPYAREVSGIEIYGDALNWWDQAEGLYDRGNRPQVGAVMAFQPHRNMQLGHVAAVSKIIDTRTVLLRHANWSPINGRRGQIENDVRAVDVSPHNDWSEVRVWYDPLQALGKTAWPVRGFIYAKKARGLRSAARLAQAIAPAKPQSTEPSRQFASAFAPLGKAARPQVASTGAGTSKNLKAGSSRNDFANQFAKFGS